MKSARSLMCVAILSLSASGAFAAAQTELLKDSVQGSVQVSSAKAGKAQSLLIEGDAAQALYESLQIKPVITQNEWAFDKATKTGPSIVCIRNEVYEGVVVRPEFTCVTTLSAQGKLTAH